MTSNEVEDDGHDEEKRAIRRPRKRKECEKEEVEERLNDEVQRASKIGKKGKIYCDKINVTLRKICKTPIFFFSEISFFEFTTKAKKSMVMAADYDYNFDVVDTPVP